MRLGDLFFDGVPADAEDLEIAGLTADSRNVKPGFLFAALKGVAGNWTYEDMNKWLAKPSAFAPGTRMAFAGIKEEKQRADVIAYLRSLAKSPLPLP